MRSADVVRYALWAAVAATAARNRTAYRVPTAWLTHLVANTVTLFLPDALRVAHAPVERRMSGPLARACWRVIDRRVRQDPRYAGYVAPLALGFIASHADFSIYHGKWGKRTLMGFGVDSVPHAAAAYALARLVSESVATLDDELPPDTVVSSVSAWSAEHVDLIAAAVVATVTLVWEVGEYTAHIAEIEATGRDASEVNMQWTLPDAITDSVSNLGGLIAAICVRRRAVS